MTPISRLPAWRGLGSAVAVCAMAIAVAAQAQTPPPCGTGEPPPLTDAPLLEFCVASKPSQLLDPIMPNVNQANCPLPGGGTSRTWVKVKLMTDGKVFNPTTPHPVKQIIITVHGSGGAPGPVFDTISANITNPNDVWIVAPQFIDYGERRTPEAGHLYWECAAGDKPVGRNIGDASVYPAGVQVSTFNVLDHLIKKMKAAADPATLQEIVLIGHSAGARLVSRYSMSTHIEDDVQIPVRYLMASPSSWAYLTPTRYTYHPKQAVKFREKTSFSANCDGVPPDTDVAYDDYPFGLGGLDLRTPETHYVNGTRQQFFDRLHNKPRLYLMGANDTVTGDDHCGPMQQESNRIRRIHTYWNHLKTVGAAVNANFCTVAGAQHAAEDVLGSAAATKYWQLGNVTGVNDCDIGPTGPLP